MIHAAGWVRWSACTARTLSEDLRSRLITAAEGGLSRRAAADRFGVAAATAVRWVRDWRATGAIRAKAKGGNLRSARIEASRDAILAAVEAQVDITPVELSGLLHRNMPPPSRPARSGASWTGAP